MDIGLLLRLRNTAHEALAANPAEHGSAWRGLVETYTQLRSAVAADVDHERRDELDRLFPETIDTKSAQGSMTAPHTLLGQQNVASDARTRLAGLAGWLNGFIEAAQFEMRLHAEADAYAKERVKAERGIGFKGS